MPLLPLLVLLLGASVQVPARWTPQLAFTVKRIGTVAVSADGQWAAVEVSEPVMDAEPSAWRSSVRVYALRGAETRTPRVMESAASAPAWSPDGRWLAFVSDRAGKRNVWRVGLDGAPAERVTDVTGELGEFRWSPDGRRIALVATDPSSEAEPRVMGEGQRYARLYIVDVPDGAARRRGDGRSRVRLGAGRFGRSLLALAFALGGRLGAG
jgi:dipeptidyl aminopeptidase/acylaminoacyl peptidase